MKESYLLLTALHTRDDDYLHEWLVFGTLDEAVTARDDMYAHQEGRSTKIVSAVILKVCEVCA